MTWLRSNADLRPERRTGAACSRRGRPRRATQRDLRRNVSRRLARRSTTRRSLGADRARGDASAGTSCASGSGSPEGSPCGQFAALVHDIPRTHVVADRAHVHRSRRAADADLGAAARGEGRRRRTAGSDPSTWTPRREHTVLFRRLHAGRARTRTLAAAARRASAACMFVVDTTNTKPGASGRSGSGTAVVRKVAARLSGPSKRP